MRGEDYRGRYPEHIPRTIDREEISLICYPERAPEPRLRCGGGVASVSARWAGPHAPQQLRINKRTSEDICLSVRDSKGQSNVDARPCEKDKRNARGVVSRGDGITERGPRKTQSAPICSLARRRSDKTWQPEWNSEPWLVCPSRSICFFFLEKKRRSRDSPLLLLTSRLSSIVCCFFASFTHRQARPCRVAEEVVRVNCFFFGI